MPDWRALLAADPGRWEAARRDAQGPRVLIATSTGGHKPMTVVESTLAVALTLRGARVELLLCDEALPGCMQAHIGRYDGVEEFVRQGPQGELCASCFGVGRRFYDALGLPVRRYNEFLTDADRARAWAMARDLPLSEVGAWTHDGLALGEHAVAGALRFFTRGDFRDEPAAEPVLQRYVAASIITATMTERLLDAGRYEHAVFHHGIYVPQGVIGEVARRRGVHVVNWDMGYRARTFLFSHGDSVHHTMGQEPNSSWEDIPWAQEQEDEVLGYLRSRWRGSEDWIKYNDRPVEELTVIAEELGLDSTRPWVTLLTNVVWDAQLHFEANAFRSMLDWVMETVRYFEGRPDLQLIVRVHPGEVTSTLPSRQKVVDELRAAFGELPANVKVVPPESRLSTYIIADHSDAVLIYGTKTGVETTSLGIPTIVAGEAWLRDRGISMDASSPEEYFGLLDRLPLGERMAAESVRRARKYAYHFFFRRMIPWTVVEPTGEWPPLRVVVDGVAGLEAGQDAGLDVVCEGILRGLPFIYRAEREQLAGV